MSAYHGRGGQVVWTTMTHLDGNVRSWTMDYTADEEDVTAFGSPTSTAPYPRSFIGGLSQWSGSYEAMLDSSSHPEPSDVGVVDYVRLETGQVSYKGSAFITGWNPAGMVDGVPTVTVSFRGTNALAVSNIT